MPDDTFDSKPRLKPLLPPDWNDEITDALGSFPRGLKFVQDGWAESGSAVRGTHLLGTLAQHPALAKAFLTFNNYINSNDNLTVRERELLILRTGWLRHCQYEFVMHAIIGLRSGLTEADIERVMEGPDASGWQEEDADLVRAVDELHQDARLSDVTWNRLSARYSPQQIMDIIFLMGCYDTVAMAVRSFNTPLEAAELPLEEPFRSTVLNAFSETP